MKKIDSNCFILSEVTSWGCSEDLGSGPLCYVFFNLSFFFFFSCMIHPLSSALPPIFSMRLLCISSFLPQFHIFVSLYLDFICLYLHSMIKIFWYILRFLISSMISTIPWVHSPKVTGLSSFEAIEEFIRLLTSRSHRPKH